MQEASLMISDASSTLFEFTALNKPAVWCDFYKLRWSYRGIFKFRLKNRLDDDLKYFGKVASQVNNVTELLAQVNLHISTPKLKELDRLAMTEYLTGKVDGQCSERIAQFITSETAQ
jgi:CDP-glycerol glycerophosphotransferase (TagB/SpsB family)